MDRLHESAELLSNYLDHVESALKHGEANLAEQFDLTYVDNYDASPSCARINPAKLFSRIKALESELPKLMDEANNIVDESKWFSGAVMEDSSITAAALFTAVDCSTRQLGKADKDAEGALMDALKRHREAVHSYNMRHEYIREKAFAAELPPISVEGQDVHIEEEKEAPVPREKEPDERIKKAASIGGGRPRVKKEPSTRKVGSEGRTKLGGTRGGGEAKAEMIAAKSEAASDDGFEEITKVKYNRLPRNLKVGNLADLNELYRRIYDVLSNHRGPMAEDELLLAAGETNAKKLSSLRGLSVLRMADNGWYLAGKR